MAGELELYMKFEADVSELEKKLNKTAEQFSRKFDNSFRGIIDKNLNKFRQFAKLVSETKDIVYQGLSTGNVRGVAQGLGNIVSGFAVTGGAAGGAGAGAGAAGGGAAAGASILGLLAVIAGVVIGIMMLVKKMISLGTEASGHMKAALRLFGTAVKLYFKPLADAVGMILVPILLFILRKFIIPMIKIWSEVYKLIREKGFWGALKEIFMDVIDLIWNKFLKNIDFSKGIIGVANKLWDWFLEKIDMTAFGRAVKRIANWAKSIIGGIKSAFEKLKEWFSKVKERLASIGSAVKERVLNAISTAVEKVKEFGGKVYEFFGKIKDALIEKFEEIRNKVSEWITTLKAKASEVIDTVKEKISGFISSVKEKVAALELGDKISSAWNTLKTKVHEWTDKVKDKLTGFIESIKRKVAAFDFSGFISSVADKIKQAITGTFNAIWNAIKKFFTGIWNKLKGAISGFDLPNIDLNIPGFQVGGYVKETGLALLHRGEVVIPAWQVPELRNMGGGGVQVGSINVTVNVERVSSDMDLDRLARELADKIMREMEIRGGM